jgi:hypothetical protein
MKEAVSTYETSISFYETAGRNIPEDSLEYLKSQSFVIQNNLETYLIPIPPSLQLSKV